MVSFNLSTVQFMPSSSRCSKSFKGVVSTSSLDELHRTALSWLDEHCSLPILRPSKWGHGGVSQVAAAETQAPPQLVFTHLGQEGEALQGEGVQRLASAFCRLRCPADDQIQLVFLRIYSSPGLVSVCFQTLSCSVLTRIKAVYSGHRDKQNEARVCVPLSCRWQ